MNSSELKNRAVASLTGNWGSAAIMMLIFCVINMALSVGLDVALAEGVGSLVATILLLPMIWGVAITFLEVSRGDKVNLGNLTAGYQDFLRIFLTMLLKNVYIILWSLLFCIPGIIKSYSYAMTEFILRDNPEMKNNEAIERSMDLMQGHKEDLFLLDLSFIGWAILSCLTLGIGFLFLGPYMYTAHAHFYEDLLKEEEKVAEE